MALGRSQRILKHFCVICAVAFIVTFSKRLFVVFTGFHITADIVYTNSTLALPVTTTAPPAQRKVLGRHKYLPNGLLQVNKNGPHPIYELMERAEEDWNNKLRRASKTLEDAVKEYRRRYRRYPPKGFDVW